MQLQMNTALAASYVSASQKARIITESWVLNNLYCPRCGNHSVSHYENNRPVADFYCSNCQSQFELKSKSGKSFDVVTDGAYSSMISRITSLDNPDFFFLSYSKANWTVQNFFFVPKHFFTPDIIEQRQPLSSTARRAGWIGCNILLNRIPSAGKIPIIENGVEIDKETVLEKVSKAKKLVVSSISDRGWLLDVLICVERIAGITFSLSEVYKYENELSEKHPCNNNIRPKIRQQLQILRDMGVIEFLQRGEYKKVI